MTLATFDPTQFPGFGFPFSWTPDFFNLPSAVTSSGASIDLGIAQYPLHTFEMSFELLRDFGGSPTEFKKLIGFFTQQGGTIGRFWFINPDDNTVTGGFVGTGDGTTTSFLIGRSLQGVIYEPVGLVDPNNVYLNGVLQTSGFTVDITTPMRQTITFASAPGAGVVVTMDFFFSYYCRLSENGLTFDKFSSQRWSVAKVKMQSCRFGA